MSTRPLIALTGATGFVGRAALSALEKAGFRVRALARRLPTDPTTADWVEGDLADRGSLAQLVAARKR